MSTAPSRKDLILLVADKDMEMSLKGLLSRHQSLGFRPVSFDLFVHPDRDPGCFYKCHDFLRSSAKRYERAMVLVDHHGCGREGDDRAVLEMDIERRLGESGWEDRAAAIVISPELEIWVWSDSPKVDLVLGWREQVPLREWLREKNLLEEGAFKPADPKSAVELVRRTAGQPKSSAIFLELARGVGTDRCSDPAFSKLKQCLREWFPA
jgi:hypothetical protein